MTALSGGGKTTILRAIVGLEPYESGNVRLDGTAGMVFQHHSLFEHLTAIENVTLAPVHVAKSSPAARRNAWPSPGRWP
jgi:ABC-type polar amino acid transport system ATPase subunit